jgi:hypothetical protein
VSERSAGGAPVRNISNLARYRADFDRLLKLGESMQIDLSLRAVAAERKLKPLETEVAAKVKGSFEKDYQRWFTESHVLVKQLVPHRLVEFDQLYKGDGKRRTINAMTYHIQDWLNGVRAETNRYTGERPFDDLAVVVMRFQTQLGIVGSIESRFESSLFDIRQLLQADLFDSEIDAARELAKHGFLRASGAVVGVVLEKHLRLVADNHELAVKKQHPSISDLNELLKTAGVVDTPVWRGIQRLADLRNLCDHSKGRDPSKDEVIELVDGVEKAVKTLF